MDTLFIIAVVAFLGSIFGSRMVMDKAGHKLDTAQKAALIDLTARERKTGMFILLAMVVVFLAVMYLKLFDYRIASIVYFCGFGAYMIAMSVVTFRKLQQQNYPADYLKSFKLSTLIRVSGIVFFFIIVINQFLKF
jgi:hypothetical protein